MEEQDMSRLENLSTAGDRRPRVVIVGAGFGGLEAAKRLSDAPVEVVMVDRNNYHKFQPLLYQVATAGLETGSIAKAVRGIFHDQSNFRFFKGKVEVVDWKSRRILLADGRAIEYDYLIAAAGASTNYFGVEGVEEHAFPMKNLDDAVRLRNHILEQFELANQEPSLIDEGNLNFVIVGGGPTGTEMAGALVELFDCVLNKDFPTVEVDRANVILVEMAPHLLAAYDESLQDYTRETLEERGVDVRLEETVVKAEPEKVHMKSGDTIPTRTLIWAAGVKANPLADRLGLEQTRSGQIIVEPELSAPGHPEAFIVGDMAYTEAEEGRAYPQLAPVAIQEGRHAADQILRHLEGRPAERFSYHDRGQMATIGRNAAVAELPYGIKLRGFIAWIIWAFLHIAELIGFHNKISVFLDWVYNYFTYDRSARLIFDEFEEVLPGAVAEATATSPRKQTST